ncbi:MAG: cupin domain-containing protein [Candidatus Binatia bacterium]
MAHKTNVWNSTEFSRHRRRVLLAKEPDLMIALNCYQPGAQNELHYHEGTSQSFLVLKGACTVRTMKDGVLSEHTCSQGDSILIPGGEYYQMHNETDEPVVLYQVKKPADRIVVYGKEKMSNKDYFTKEREEKKVL